MSTEPTPINDVVVNYPLSLPDLTALMIKHYGLHEGLYELMVEFQVGMGSVGPHPDAQLPGAMVGLSKLGLVKVVAAGKTTVDAAAINPAPAKKLKKNRI